MKYEIKGDSLPVVICQLEAGEQMLTEGGRACRGCPPTCRWKPPAMEVSAKLWDACLPGRNYSRIFIRAQGGPGMIAFASSFPGSIKPFQITPGNDMICQKSAFLAGEMGVQLSVAVNKKIGSGFFGGEGFIMQRLSGQGIFFAEFDGHVIEYELKPGQQIVVDTGHLAAMTASCQMEIQTVPGMKNKFLGGEGLFNTVITGPGHVWLQTMPLSNVAGVLRAYLPTSN